MVMVITIIMIVTTYLLAIMIQHKGDGDGGDYDGNDGDGDDGYNAKEN